MSTQILSRTINSLLDKKLVLETSQAARVISIGTNWNEIWIGARIAMTDAGGNLIASPRFYMGFLSAPDSTLSNGPLGNTTSHYVGLQSNVATIVRATSPVANYNIVVRGMKKVATSVTAGSQAAINTFISAVPDLRRTCLFFRLLKGSPNFTYGVIQVSAASGVVDVTEAQIKGALETSIFNSDITAYLNAALGGTPYGTSSTNTIAVNEGANGALDSICLAWDRSVPTFEFSDLYWVQKS